MRSLNYDLPVYEIQARLRKLENKPGKIIQKEMHREEWEHNQSIERERTKLFDSHICKHDGG